jgi:hypothetical protein
MDLLTASSFASLVNETAIEFVPEANLGLNCAIRFHSIALTKHYCFAKMPMTPGSLGYPTSVRLCSAAISFISLIKKLHVFRSAILLFVSLEPDVKGEKLYL